VPQQGLNEAVEQLFSSPRMLRRFRRNPDRALSRFDVTPAEAVALRSGDAEELLVMGIDPAWIWPQPPGHAAQNWLQRNARRLAPAAFLAAVMVAWPAAGHAATPTRRTFLRRAARYLQRHPALARRLEDPALAQALRRAGVPRTYRQSLLRGIDRAVHPPAPRS
jgi:hypothetical protein